MKRSQFPELHIADWVFGQGDSPVETSPSRLAKQDDVVFISAQ